ncbi:MAG: hypothetical protein IIB41_06985, partial [Candidatus Marinimicrobia bacterium]|nr:hypothetical protein [Candidatus Neomarinimicrobiota bacterium]
VGSYDPNAVLDYSAIGADLSFAIGPIKINSEYVTAPTQFSAWDRTTTKNVLIDEYTTNGYYVQAVYPFAEKWELVGMYDILEREMAELAEADFNGSEVKLIQAGVHEETNRITKISFGINFSPIGTLKIKTEYAFFSFKAGEHGHTEPDNVHRISTAFVISF